MKAAVKPSDEFLVVSVCAGVGITEMESSNTLTLCLDKDKRSLQTGVICMNRASANSSRVILAQFNYRTNLEDLLIAVSASTRKPIKVLLQHPTPSSEGVGDLKAACKGILNCVLKRVVSSLSIVYDYSSNRNTWSKKLFMLSCFADHVATSFAISDEILISKKGEDSVQHPVYGDTKRYGWAKTRNADEHSFVITLK